MPGEPQFFAAISIFVALIAVWVAHQQAKTNRLKLKFDLYERRLAYFSALTEFLVAASRGNVTSEERLKFAQKTHDSNFLFGEDVAGYLKLVHNNAVDLNSIRSQFEESNLLPKEEKARLINKRAQLEKWFNRQFEASKEIFSQFLSFEKLK